MGFRRPVSRREPGREAASQRGDGGRRVVAGSLGRRAGGKVFAKASGRFRFNHGGGAREAQAEQTNEDR